MTLASIFKTAFQIYCSSIVSNAIAPDYFPLQAITEPSNYVPVLIEESAKMTPVAPPEDRGSGR